MTTTNIPGLEELRKALDAVQNDEGRYAAEFANMMEDEQNDGVNPPAPRNQALRDKADALKAQYPRAAMYLRAEGYACSNNINKYAAGIRAMEIISNGGDIEDAEYALNNWLPESALWN